MLFRSADLDAIRTGERRLTFRRWRRPSARAGTLLRTAVGLVAIESVERIEAGAITEAEARQAGFADLPALRRMLASREGDCYRIALRYAGSDPRPDPADDPLLDATERSGIATRLAALDRRAPGGPWTADTLRLIADHPARAARELAALAGRERDVFKADVRKLKALGLTRSLDVGYELSPRGRSYLEPADFPPKHL